MRVEQRRRLGRDARLRRLVARRVADERLERAARRVGVLQPHLPAAQRHRESTNSVQEMANTRNQTDSVSATGQNGNNVLHAPVQLVMKRKVDQGHLDRERGVGGVTCVGRRGCAARRSAAGAPAAGPRCPP